MPLKIIRQDITKISCDAIVNPTDPYYSHGGGTDLAIHEAAGAELFTACIKKGRLSVGRVVITPAFALPCRFVIHTVGPEWEGGARGEEALLRSCYRESLRTAAENKCKSIAFPLIASGTFGFPKDRVLRIAVDEIGQFLMDSEMLVYLVVFDKSAYSISEKLFSDVVAFIDDAYADPLCAMREYLSKAAPTSKAPRAARKKVCREETKKSLAPLAAGSLDDLLRNMDKGFADTLFELIDQKGLTDVECYKRANVDKKTFSKIKCNKDYRPSKITVISFAIALHLNMEETERLLRTVGMSLSRSNKFDVIIEYFITTGNYQSIFDVNETLYQFDQVTLGV